MARKKILGVLSSFLFGIVALYIIGFFLITLVFETKVGSCLILEEINCKKVSFILNPNTNNSYLASYNLANGTKIFAPDDGELVENSASSFKGSANGKNYGVLLITTNKQGKKIIYNFIFSEIPIAESGKKSIKRGEVLFTSKLEHKVLNHSLIISITAKDKVSAIEYENITKQLLSN